MDYDWFGIKGIISEPKRMNFWIALFVVANVSGKENYKPVTHDHRKIPITMDE